MRMESDCKPMMEQAGQAGQAGWAAQAEWAEQDGQALDDETAAALVPFGAQPLWLQQPGEPDMWYGRFSHYLSLGPTRSLRAALRSIGSEKGVSPTWRTNAHRWQWRARALAYDTHQRELFALSEQNIRLGMRQRRLGVIEDTLELVCATLDKANLDQADEELARRWLPQLRAFLRDLLTAERLEFERAYTRDDPDAHAPITADDLRTAQRQLEEAAQHNPSADAPLRRSLEQAAQSAPAYPATPRLLVCAGPDEGLLLDLAVLRAVRAATGLHFQRVLNATRAKFAASLRRERGLHRPVELVHLALHAGPDGVDFADGLADGNWLSERLGGVRVLLLASCAGADLGDWLGVVPYVVSLNEAISHEDAAALAHHFWQGIGLGSEPDQALAAALALCPPSVAEYVVKHW